MRSIKLAYGLRQDQLVHVSEVPKGLACECICPGCGHPLIARKGARTAHHFAHYQGPECATGVETALHLAAKAILERRKKIWIPGTGVLFGEDMVYTEISRDQELIFDEVRLENRLDQMVPDVMVYIKGRPLLIEITVTHRTGEEKIRKMRKAGLSCLEIDLSKVSRELTMDTLEQLVIDDITHKVWLHNERITQLKRTIFSLADKMPIVTRGENEHVDFCPRAIRMYFGKPYANYVVDCQWCWYQLRFQSHADSERRVGCGCEVVAYEHCNCSKEGEAFIYCLGRKRMKSMEEVLQYIDTMKVR